MDYSIKTVEEFKYYLDLNLREFKYYIIQDRFNASVVNNLNEEYLEYYQTKRTNIIALLDDKSFHIRFKFNEMSHINEKIKVNEEDYEQLFVIPNLYFNKLINLKEQLKNTKEKESYELILSFYNNDKEFIEQYFIERIKDFENCLKLAYFNLQINLIIDAIRINKNESQTVLFNTEFLYLFKKKGYEVLEYLNEHFKDVIPITVKYTILFHFLKNEKLLQGNTLQYLKFIREHYNLSLKFSRLDFSSYYDDKYSNHIKELTRLYEEFNKLKTIELD